jgi:general secretion pathway protein K
VKSGVMCSVKRAEQGAAIITALLVVMLAATIASYLLAQQSHALTRTARAADYAQVSLYAEPTLDWARAVLAESFSKNNYVHGKQPWARGLDAQPLEGAIASGAVRDEAAKFNLNNLRQDDGSKSANDMKAFAALLKNLKIDADLAPALADWLDQDNELTPNGAEDSYYLGLAAPYRAANRPLTQVAELSRVRGFDGAIIKRLLPYVTALPARSKLNLNTALPEVILAIFPEMESDQATAFVRSREDVPLRELTTLGQRPEFAKVPPASLTQFASVDSQFFSVAIAITRESVQFRQRALLQRKTGADGKATTGWPDIIWVASY